MKTMKCGYFIGILLVILVAGCSHDKVYTQSSQGGSELDKKVNDFLKSKAYSWRDMNVPESDGQLLHDIIVKNNYKNAVEIGTSTGHSGIWIAWALSKTGGKLITIEIDEDRYQEALANFKKAGVADFVDARLADAHELVPKLSGPVDFVFSDADKDWYLNYFKALEPKLVVGGCFTAHNVGMSGVREYYDYVSKLPNYKTTVDRRGGGMAISYKTAR
jgi:caffeoyl-CoA O-methyltransferase